MSEHVTLVGSVLGQARLSDTTATSLYSPADGVKTQITEILVANNTAGAIACRLFHDEDGTTYDQSTALYYDKSIGANDTLRISEASIWMSNSSGNFAGRSATGNALTFTVYGIEHL